MEVAAAVNTLLHYFDALRGAEDDDSCLRLQAGEISGHFRGLALKSVFQPLFSSHSGLPVAHEALLRAADCQGRPLRPGEVFAFPCNAQEMLFLDRLCRVVHAGNFVRQAPSGDLFLNIEGRHLLAASNHGQTFESLLKVCGLTPERIVLEILEARIDDLGRLQEAVSGYRSRGYRVAIDDFGCAHSNFDRLWQLSPDIVKLDRSLMVQAEANSRARRVLPKLVEIIHELGATVVCEGIENRTQHQLAADAGADWLQGYFYALPATALCRTPAQASAERQSFPTEFAWAFT